MHCDCGQQQAHSLPILAAGQSFPAIFWLLTVAYRGQQLVHSCSHRPSRMLNVANSRLIASRSWQSFPAVFVLLTGAHCG